MNTDLNKMNTDLNNRAIIVLLNYLGLLEADKKALENRDHSGFNERLKVYIQEDINTVENLLKDLRNGNS